jgi:type II secretory pathway pseudopilin PulG
VKNFSRPEIICLIAIFLILVGVSWPNFVLSLRRARDQVRRDDQGALVHALDEYLADFGELPTSSPDGRIMDCEKPGDKPFKDSKGRWVINAIPCDWGKDALVDLINGKVYMSILPREPDYKKGATYLYYSDGQRYQIYATMEGADEAEVDPKIIALGLACGSRTCNVGRSYNVPINVSIEEYDKQFSQK